LTGSGYGPLPSFHVDDECLSSIVAVTFLKS